VAKKLLLNTMTSKNTFHNLRSRLYAWLVLVVFLASAFSSISVELCHQIMHIPDYLSQSVTMHDRSHSHQDHTHRWMGQQTNQGSEDQLNETNNEIKLQLIKPSQANAISCSIFYRSPLIIYDLILNSEIKDIPVPPPLFV
jgi:hypothetical protein